VQTILVKRIPSDLNDALVMGGGPVIYHERWEQDDDVLMDHKCNKVLKNSWIVDFACCFHIYLKK